MTIFYIMERTFSHTIKYIIFIINFLNKRKSLKDKQFTCYCDDRLACLNDKTSTTGFDAHYLYHIAWTARRVSELSPKKHIELDSLYILSLPYQPISPRIFMIFAPHKLHLVT